jgi:hypothetical protein
VVNIKLLSKVILNENNQLIDMIYLVVAANSLKWRMSSMFHPYVELTMCGPYMSGKKRKHTTKTKSNTWMPKYNETFHL